jgi:hypothetical protein
MLLIYFLENGEKTLAPKENTQKRLFADIFISRMRRVTKIHKSNRRNFHSAHAQSDENTQQRLIADIFIPRMRRVKKIHNSD